MQYLDHIILSIILPSCKIFNLIGCLPLGQIHYTPVGGAKFSYTPPVISNSFQPPQLMLNQ